MTPEGQKQLDEAVAQYQTTIASLLTKGVTKSHIDGGVIGQKKLSMGISFDLVKQEAVDYGKQYSNDMARGGSMCYDAEKGESKFVPWMSDHSDEVRKNLADTINKGIIQGKPMPDLAADISDVTGGEQSWCMTVARTETARAQYAGSMAQYEDAGVEKVRWSNGPNPCPECQDLHDQEFTLDDCPEIPYHPNCTCDVIPIVGGE